ncbi:MAG: serine/threonine protein kinase, partial [Planktothrix sp.]
VGTYGYMAPEQFRGQAKPPTDLYGLGATLLFLLTHKDPADFPEKRMKIDFRPYVNLTPEFADWLAAMLEPVIEDRFKSAAEALAELEGKRERIVPRSVYNLQPVGSRIVLEKTPRKLHVKVPPSKLKFNHISTLLFTIFCSSFLVFFTLIFWRSGFWVMFFFIAPFWWWLIVTLGNTLRDILVSTTLNFQGDKFKASWCLFGITRRTYGKTNDICRVEVRPLHPIKSENKIIICALQVGVKSYCFGSGLTLIEQEWLVTEIAEFIGKPKLIVR